MNNHELFCSIKQQYLLSSEVAGLILNPLMEIYYAGIPAAQISYEEIGSYGRGTNNDTTQILTSCILEFQKTPSWVSLIGRKKGRTRSLKHGKGSQL